MEQLTTGKIEQYYFIRDNVIFEIKSSNDTGDACAKAWSAVTLPYIEVQKSGEEAKKYYLDVLIKDGDKYADQKFTKVVHNGDPVYSGSETIMEMANYYKALCEVQVKEDIARAFSDPTSEMIENKTDYFNIPAWMIKGLGYTLSSNAVSGEISNLQINITETYINNDKKAIVQEAAYNAAKNTVESYNYTMTTPAKPSDIVVAPK